MIFHKNEFLNRKYAVKINSVKKKFTVNWTTMSTYEKNKPKKKRYMKYLFCNLFVIKIYIKIIYI